MEEKRHIQNFRNYVRIEYQNLDPIELIKLPVSALIGIDTGDSEALSELGIDTIQDLALSRLFNFAKAITEGKTDGSVIGLGEVAQNAVREGSPISVEELVSQGIESLSDLTEDQANALKDAAAVVTIRDLALWPPFINAQGILTAAESMSQSLDLNNDEIPDELVPVMRTHATDRLSYKRVYYDHELDPRILGDSDSVGDDPPKELSHSPINLTEKSATAPMRLPAVGTIVRVDQDWYPEGVALGSLAHSVALAPGESTRIAMVDWARQDTATTDDSTTQRESISASRRDGRTISEVQKGTLKEAYEESSRTDFESDSFQTGYSASSGALESFFSGSGGYSESGASSSGFVESVGNSSGNRDVSTEMTQDIDQASQQAASSVRSARATVVTEVNQGEQIEARTRMVTNYNHMHALSIHYYEVVQIYRVVTEAKDIRPVLFIPFDTLDFRRNGSMLIERFRNILMRAALDDYTRNLLTNASAKIVWNIELKSWDYSPTYQSTEDDDYQRQRNIRTTAQRDARALARVGVEGHRWARQYKIPENVELRGVQIFGSTDGNVVEIIISLEGSRDDVTVPITSNNYHPLQANIRVGSIDKISVKGRFHEIRNSELDIARLQIAFYMTDGSRNIMIRNISWVDPSDEMKEVTVLRSDVPAISTELFDILDENRLHYSQAIWRSLSSSDIQVAIANRGIAGTPLLRLVEARILATYGNLVAMPLNIGPLSSSESPTAQHLMDWWSNIQDRKSSPRVARIPLGTGGVHAEAVLGRANSAEKLDITRFWDWQESPIPLVAPEISPVNLDSKARDISAQSRGLDPALVGFQSAPSMPDPAGLQTLSQILTASGIFSQLSSMASNAALAGQLSDNTSESARSAAEQATEANRIASQMLTEAIKTAASLYAGSQGFAIPGMSSGGTSSKQSRSEQSKTNTGFGARLNEMSKRESNGTTQTATQQQSNSSGGEGVGLDKTTPTSAGKSGGVSNPNTDQGVQMLRTDMGLEPVTDNSRNKSTPQAESTNEPLDEHTNRIRLILAGFEVSSFDLTERHIEALEYLVALKNDGLDILIERIEGRASQTGDSSNNQWLSQGRAESVAQFLIRDGYPSDFNLEAYGDSNPLQDQPGVELDINRSVVITYIARDPMPSLPEPTTEEPDQAGDCPNGTTQNWEITLPAALNAHYILGGIVAAGWLRNANDHSEIRPIFFIGTGAGASLSFGPKKGKDLWDILRRLKRETSSSLGEAEWTPFTTEGVCYSFDNFNKAFGRVTVLGAGFALGASTVKVSWPMLADGANGIEVGGVNWGEVGVSGSVNFGVWIVEDED